MSARWLPVVLALLLLVPADVWGKGRSSGSFGGSRSSGSFGRSSSSSSWGRSSTPSKPSTPSISAPSRPSTPSSSWGSRPAAPPPIIVARPPPRASKADELAHQKAVQANTFGKSGTFKSQDEARQAAEKDFREKHGPALPSTFKEKPATRPDHIPETVVVGDQTRPVVYRVENNVGGYYYDDPVRGWILYNLMADSMHRDRVMYTRGYDPSGHHYTHTSTYSTTQTRSSSGSSNAWVWIGIILIVVLVIGAWYVYSLRSMQPRSPVPQATNDKPKPAPARAAPALTTKTEASHWDRLKPGDHINLKDRQTLELLMGEGARSFALGADLTVRRVQRIVERNDLMQWSVCELEGIPLKDAEDTWYLVVKRVDEEFDLRVMFVPSDFRPGTRADMMNWGVRWLFKPPEDENHFRPGELDFTDEIDQTLDDGRTVVYRAKAQGILFGTMTEEPRRSGLEQPQFAAVLEYRADAECDNPELLLLELGGVKLPNFKGVESAEQARAIEAAARDASRDGGLIVFMQGVNVGTQDVDVLPV